MQYRIIALTSPGQIKVQIEKLLYEHYELY